MPLLVNILHDKVRLRESHLREADKKLVLHVALPCVETDHCHFFVEPVDQIKRVSIVLAYHMLLVGSGFFVRRRLAFGSARTAGCGGNLSFLSLKKN